MDNTRTKADPARRTCTFYSLRENDSTITVSIWGEVATNAVLAEAHHDGPIATEQMRVFPTQAPRRRAHACTWLQQLMKSHCVLAGLTDCLRLQFNFDEKGLAFFLLCSQRHLHFLLSVPNVHVQQEELFFLCPCMAMEPGCWVCICAYPRARRRAASVCNHKISPHTSSTHIQDGYCRIR